MTVFGTVSINQKLRSEVSMDIMGVAGTVTVHNGFTHNNIHYGNIVGINSSTIFR